MSEADPWNKVADDQVDAIFEEIAGVVRTARQNQSS
jgi:hypothetical protein